MQPARRADTGRAVRPLDERLAEAPARVRRAVGPRDRAGVPRHPAGLPSPTGSTEPAGARVPASRCSQAVPRGKCIRAWRLPTAELDLQDYADSPSLDDHGACLVPQGDGRLRAARRVRALPERRRPLCRARHSSATVWEHVRAGPAAPAAGTRPPRTVEDPLRRLVRHDERRRGRGEGESVMLAMQVKWGCDLLAELARAAGPSRVCRRDGRGRAETERERSRSSAGTASGSCAPSTMTACRWARRSRRTLDNGEGRIFLNPQSWALIAGVATPEQARRASRRREGASTPAMA